MVWKIHKQRKPDRQGRSKPKPVIESQPTLKSCLKTTKDLAAHRDSFNDSSRLQDDPNYSKAREQSTKSGTSSRGARSSNSHTSLEVASKGSGNSGSLGFSNRRKVASVEQHSVSSRGSWDRESRKSETALSTQTSERSSVDSRSHVSVIKKKVHFDSIHIRDYERVVGDNPSCTIGPPVGIGWEHGETHVIDIDSFESSKPYKKSASHLVLSREEREAILLNWGASFHDIIESVRGNLKIKNQRRQTVTNLGKIERIEEAFESATRKLKSALMLRRSTGNKVRRLQEQANLAQSALESLKMAESRALSEIRGESHIEIVEEPKSQEDLNSFPMANYGPSSAEDTEVRSPMISPEEDEHPSKSYPVGNSTTQSELEIERFYRELELEMFGEEELPSMVGRELDVEEASVNSGMTERYSRDGLDDELLEKEQNRSMISQYLLEDADYDPKVNHSPHEQGEQDGNHYYYSSQPRQPLHRDQMTQQNRSSWNSNGPMEFPSGSRVNETPRDAIYQEPYRKQTIPLHAGMTMFEDCALLGDQISPSSYQQRKPRSSRRRDLNAGPKVQFIPPPTHLTPSQWMDGSDPHSIPSWSNDTITISEEGFGETRYSERQSYPHYNNNMFPPKFY